MNKVAINQNLGMISFKLREYLALCMEKPQWKSLQSTLLFFNKNCGTADDKTVVMNEICLNNILLTS